MTPKMNRDGLKNLGTFEISKYLLAKANENKQLSGVYNAGQGNPNWINAKARLAFARLIAFGVNESRRTINKGDLAGYIEKVGISNRLKEFLKAQDALEDKFLLEALSFVVTRLSIDEDSLVAEWTNGVIGNDYPTPSRVLICTEKILKAYLNHVLFKGKDMSDETTLFLTEGGTAAIVYIFQSLKENHLIAFGDKIAINTPIFPPYLCIPDLNDYEMVELDFRSKEENNWQLDPKELDKLKDPSIKAFFIVNPSNPGSKALDKKDLDKLQEVVKENPNLMIVTDDVYGTFVDGFESIYSVLPHNTLLVYSFSKLFGATGWRLGIIAANKTNLFDKKISQLNSDQKEELDKRYKSDAICPSEMAFIDRICADSRSIGLYHTSGLSTPQQIMEVLFALTHLVEEEKQGTYIETTKKIIAERYNGLHDSLSMKKDDSHLNSKYYSLINFYEIAEKLHNKAFSDYLVKTYETIDILVDLATKKGVVLTYGPGFGASAGYMRVSEANLPTKDYKIMGEKIVELVNDYYSDYEKMNEK